MDAWVPKLQKAGIGTLGGANTTGRGQYHWGGQYHQEEWVKPALLAGLSERDQRPPTCTDDTNRDAFCQQQCVSPPIPILQ